MNNVKMPKISYPTDEELEDMYEIQYPTEEELDAMYEEFIKSGSFSELFDEIPF